MMSLRKNEIFWLFVLKIAFEKCKYIENYRVEELTGPDLLKECIDLYISNKTNMYFDDTFQSKSDILILPTSYMYPIDWSVGWYPTKPIEYDGLIKENKCVEDIRKLYPESYAITFWNHNWN